MSEKHTPCKFCDVNAGVGWPARGGAEFATVADLIAHLDRLGVSQALVSHVSARDVHPTWGNKELLNSLGEIPAARQRLVPSLTVGATMLHELGAMAELRKQLQSQASRSVRLFPRSLNHHLEHVVPILTYLQDLAPAILVDFEELSSAEDLGKLADRFATLTFICTRIAWHGLASAYDLLARHRNVLLDISWMHTCGTIEDMVNRYGSERLVFGLGPKSNAGASIAALHDAQIPSRAKDAIAGGNISRLLKLTQTSVPEPSSDRLWSRLIKGERIGLDIVDAHGHLGPFNTWMLPVQQIEPQMADISERMRRLSIHKMIVSGTHALFGECLAGNHLIEKAAGSHDNFHGYLVFNPHHAEALLPHVEDFFSREFFVGFKLLSSYWAVPVTDRRYEPVWEYANRFHLPILLHTWEDSYDLPMMLDKIAGKYREAIFLLGHSGGTNVGRASALELAQRHPNIYLEWCGSYRMTLPYEDLITTLGPRRFIFGTDATLHSPAWELGRFLSLDLPDEMLLPALGENIRRILAGRLR